MTGIGKQAKVLTEAQIRASLAAVKTVSERVMILLSAKAGLRACEIANLKWPMVCDVEGRIAEAIALENTATKGKVSGREIPMHPDLRAALAELNTARIPPNNEFHAQFVILCWRGRRLTRQAVVTRFHRLYKSLGFQGASSHSGRRTFITRGARKIVEAGGSLRDVQQLAGHASLSTTQRYIEGSSEAKRRVIALI